MEKRRNKLHVGFFLGCCKRICFLDFLREQRTMRIEAQFGVFILLFTEAVTDSRLSDCSDSSGPRDLSIKCQLNL